MSLQATFKRPIVRTVWPILVAGLLLGVTGCAANEPAPEKTPRAGTEVRASKERPADEASRPQDQKTDSVEVADSSLKIPACEGQVSAGTLQATGFRYETTGSGTQLSQKQIGPAAQEAMAAAKQVQECVYWPAIAGDVMETVTISELDGPTRDAFVGKLVASDFLQSELDGATVFTYQQNQGTRDATFSRHLFAGNTWISMQGNSGLHAMAHIGLATDTLTSLRNVNSGL